MRDCRRIQKIIHVRSDAATSIAVPSKTASAWPSSSAPMPKSTAPTPTLMAMAAEAPIQTGQKPSRRPVRSRNARTIPTTSDTSKPSLNITRPALNLRLRRFV